MIRGLLSTICGFISPSVSILEFVQWVATAGALLWGRYSPAPGWTPRFSANNLSSILQQLQLKTFRDLRYDNQHKHLHLSPTPTYGIIMKPSRLAMDTGFDNSIWLKVYWYLCSDSSIYEPGRGINKRRSIARGKVRVQTYQRRWTLILRCKYNSIITS